MRIEYTKHGIPVPYERMNSRNTWAERVQNYLAYKKLIAGELRTLYPDLVLDIPPAEDKKARTKFLNAHKGILYELHLKVVVDKERGDVDNYLKCAMDACQDAGLIVNDKRIRRGSFELSIGPDPLLSFTLATIEVDP